MSTRNVKFTQPKQSRRGAAQASKASSSTKSPRKSAPVSKALRRYQATSPKMVSTNGTVNVSHREFVQDVTGQTAFTTTSFPINPARDVLFTWLSDVAARYERYQFSSLRFCYEPRCSTATAGSVVLAVDYDPLDAAPLTKQDVYAYHHTAQSSPWDECSLIVDPSILANRGSLYTRVGAVPSGADAKTYDLGNLWLCVSGFSGAVVCGELFVEYTVTLKIPQIQSNVQSAYYGGTAGVTKSVPFGTAPLVATAGDAGTGSALLDISVTGTTITFNQEWRGNVTTKVTGTGVVAWPQGGTATITSIIDEVNAASTEGFSMDRVVAARGQTLVPDMSGCTTVTAVVVYFLPY